MSIGFDNGGVFSYLTVVGPKVSLNCAAGVCQIFSRCRRDRRVRRASHATEKTVFQPIQREEPRQGMTDAHGKNDQAATGRDRHPQPPHGRYERNVKAAACWPKLLFEAQAQITKSVAEWGSGVVIIKVVRDPETKLGFAGDSKSHRCLREIKRLLASIAGVLKTILKLQASTGHDNTRTRDLRPIRGNRALRIGAASLSPHFGCDGSHYDGKEQCSTCGPRHVQDNNQKSSRASRWSKSAVKLLED
jgi:hypothetical protein